MTAVSGFDTKRWLLAFLSPYMEDPPLPADHSSWADILQAADHGLVLPRLAIEAASRANDFPREVREHLELSLELNRLRNLELREQLLGLLRRLNEGGVVPVIIKGATTLFEETRDPGARVMLDMDIWTPAADDQQTAKRCLCELGYETRASDDEYEGLHHGPPFFLAGAFSRIELHHSLLHSSVARMLDEGEVIGSLRNRSFNGARFQVLDDTTALKLSYLQGRAMGEEGYIIFMKWLDFLDRCHALGVTRITNLSDLGMSQDATDIDHRFLTALGQLCGLPYEGSRDAQLLQRWQKAHQQHIAALFLQIVIGNARDPARWRNRTPAEYWRAFTWRIKEMQASYHRAHSRDAF